MTRNKITLSLALIFIAACILAYKPSVKVHQNKSEEFSYATFLRMLANQPDFVADRRIIIPGYNNLSSTGMYAKKGNRARLDDYLIEKEPGPEGRPDRYYRIITLNQIDGPPLGFDPQEKTYTEFAADYKVKAFNIDTFLPGSKSEMDKLRVEDLGTASLDGHEVRKIRLTSEGEDGELIFYFASDLKNLVINVEAGPTRRADTVPSESNSSSPKASFYKLTNISLDVPDSLFEAPKGYRKVDIDSFMSNVFRRAKR